MNPKNMESMKHKLEHWGNILDRQVASCHTQDGQDMVSPIPHLYPFKTYLRIESSSVQGVEGWGIHFRPSFNTAIFSSFLKLSIATSNLLNEVYDGFVAVSKEHLNKTNLKKVG